MISGFTILYTIFLISSLITSAYTGKAIAIAQSLADRDDTFQWTPRIKKIWGLYAFAIGNVLFTVFLTYQLVTVK